MTTNPTDTTITFTRGETNAVMIALAVGMAQVDWLDPSTAHGGLGQDECEFCTAWNKVQSQRVSTVQFS